MLFLLNQQVLDLDVAETTLRSFAGGRAAELERMSPRAVMSLGQDIYFNLPAGAEPDDKAKKILACLIAMKIEADAAVFVRPQHARSAQDVAIRFASLPITTLSFLESMQDARMLTPKLINDSVWSQAAEAAD